MDTIEYIDLVKKQCCLRTDYSLARALQVTPQTIDGYRHRGRALSEQVALRVADLLMINPGIVLSDIAATRAKQTEVRRAWLDVSKSLTTVFVAATVTWKGWDVLGDAVAAAQQCILCQIVESTDLDDLG